MRPNLLWIVMDDVGSEFPCYGEKAIQTPHIDRLVNDSIPIALDYPGK